MFSFVGKEAVEWMLSKGLASSVAEAVNIGNVLVAANVIRCDIEYEASKATLRCGPLVPKLHRSFVLRCACVVSARS